LYCGEVVETIQPFLPIGMKTPMSIALSPPLPGDILLPFLSPARGSAIAFEQKNRHPERSEAKSRDLFMQRMPHE
jgi:hypothetical protein